WDYVVSEYGHANLIINKASVGMAGSAEELSLDDIEWLMGINFWGVIHGTKMFLPILKQQPQGHIVNISSIFGIIGMPGHSAYVASKFAVRGFSEAMRHELQMAGSHIRISVVHPELGDVAAEEQADRPVRDDAKLAREERKLVQVVRPRDEPAGKAAYPQAGDVRD